MRSKPYIDRDGPGCPTVEDLDRLDGLIVRNAVTCGICQSPADRYNNRFQCQAHPGHVGDLNVGIFSDLTYPSISENK